MTKKEGMAGWLDNPEKRMKLVRIAYFISLIMVVLGFVLIILSYMYPGFLP
jgi:hypothetical protein